MNGNRIARRLAPWTVAALTATAAAAALPFSGATADPGPTVAKFATTSTSQKAIVSAKAISVSVSNLSLPSASVVVKLQRGSTESTVTSAKTVTAGTGWRSAKLTLSSTGKTKVSSCSAGTLNIYVGGVKAGSEPMYIDSTSCLSTPSSIDTATASRCDITDQADCIYPFPNNFFTKADSSTGTGRKLNFQLLSMPVTVPTLFQGRKYIGVDELNRFDGFSPGSMLITHVPGLVTDQAVRNSGLVTADDIGKYADPNQSVVVIDTTTGERWPVWAEVDHSAMVKGQSVDGEWVEEAASDAEKAAGVNLIIRPAKNFTDGHRYVVGLRNLRDANNNPIPASDGFRIFRDRLVGKRASIESRRASMESIFTTLKNAGIERSNLNLAWDFTVASTRSLSERMLKIRDEAFAQLGDTTMADGIMQGSSPVWHITKITNTPSDPDTIRQVDGTIDVPCYLTTTNCISGGKYNLGSDGLPVQLPGNKYSARFRCNIPQSAVDGNGQVEMTLYGHGLFGSISEMGSRNVRQLGNENRMLVCGSDWIGMASEDELTAVPILADLTNFPKMADRLQEGYLGFMFLGRAMAHASGMTTDPAFQISSGGNSASYGTGNIGYYGNSQGGIAGGGLTAVSPDIKRSVLYVGAMNYSTLLTRSVDFDDFKPYFYPNYPKLVQRPLLFALMQIMWDRGEPNGYANHITSDPLPNTPTKKVVMEMSYGDHQVANIATEVQARTMGLKVRRPYMDLTRDTTGTIHAWGLQTLGAMPLDDNALISWDIGPYRTPDAPNCKDNSNDTWCGTPAPPFENLPNRVGTDPHDLNIETMATLRHQIAEFIKPGGKLIDVCGATPCYGAGWTGLN